jgi:hypothetical protein
MMLNFTIFTDINHGIEMSLRVVYLLMYCQTKAYTIKHNRKANQFVALALRAQEEKITQQGFG